MCADVSGIFDSPPGTRAGYIRYCEFSMTVIGKIGQLTCCMSFQQMGCPNVINSEKTFFL